LQVNQTRVYTEPGWYACRTRSRAEKQVARILSERGLDNYLPTLPRLRQWKDRKTVVSFPLFPGYLFGRFPLRDTHVVLGITGVSSIVCNQGRPSLIADEELINVRRFAAALAGSGKEPVPCSWDMAGGQAVRVTSGPFEGVAGWIIEGRSRHRMLVGIQAIGRALEIDIPVRYLEPVSDGRQHDD
jgi:transcription antitermination factor NusG